MVQVKAQSQGLGIGSDEVNHRGLGVHKTVEDEGKEAIKMLSFTSTATG